MSSKAPVLLPLCSLKPSATFPQTGKPTQVVEAIAKIGALGEIRTPDPQIRSLVLYPAELRARMRATLRASKKWRRKRQ